MVDAGASDAFWPQNYKWAQRTAEKLAAYQVAWFEEPLDPEDNTGRGRSLVICKILASYRGAL